MFNISFGIIQSAWNFVKKKNAFIIFQSIHSHSIWNISRLFHDVSKTPSFLQSLSIFKFSDAWIHMKFVRYCSFHCTEKCDEKTEKSLRHSLFAEVYFFYWLLLFAWVVRIKWNQKSRTFRRPCFATRRLCQSTRLFLHNARSHTRQLRIRMTRLDSTRSALFFSFFSFLNSASKHCWGSSIGR